MDQERWEQVKTLYWAALELSPQERGELLQEAERDVRDEVLSLLSHADAPFFDRDAMQHAIQILQNDDVPAMLGPYRIVREVGRGGMASVYLAERADGQFEKQVAIKILRGGIYGEDMRRRFLRERQLLAGLEHANIVRLLDGNVLPDGRPFLIEDFVNGEPITKYALSHRLNAQQRMLLLSEVTKGVAYAHACGVVHRDLKPANILVNREGIPKLLDFGVARLWDVNHNPQSHETQTRYWTPGYASPEQARGLAAGPASDVFSLGLIMYELLTNRPAISTRGLSPFDAARRVVEFEPDMQAIPPAMRDTLAQCLARDSARRITAQQLQSLLQNVDSSLRHSNVWNRRNLVWTGCSATLGFVAWRAFRTHTPRFYEVHGRAGFNGEPCFSPNGEHVVFMNQDRGLTRLLVKNRRSGVMHRLLEAGEFGIQQPSGPRWAPNGAWIAFRSVNATGEVEIYTIPATGGAVRKVTGHVEFALAWSAGSDALLISRRLPTGGRALFRTALDDRREMQLTSPQSDLWGDLWMAISANGRYLAVVRYVTPGDGDVFLFESNGKLLRRLTDWHSWILGITFRPDGSEVLCCPILEGKERLARVSTRGDRAISFIELPQGVAPNSPCYGPRGEIAVANVSQRITCYRGRIEGTRVRETKFLAGAEEEAEWPAFRPDGGAVAWAGVRSGSRGVWMSETKGNGVQRIGALLSEVVSELSWSPDMKYIAYTMKVNGRPAVHVLEVATGTARALHEDSSQGCASWSADGKWIYFLSSREAVRRFYRMPWPGGGKLEAITPVAVDGREAPGGRSFLYLPSDKSRLMAVGLQGQPPRVAADIPPLRIHYWGVSGNSLFYLDDYQGHATLVYTYDFETKSNHLLVDIPTYRPGMNAGLAVSPDCKEVLWVYPDRTSQILIAEGVL